MIWLQQTDQNTDYPCRRKFLASSQAPRCELRMVRGDQSAVWVSQVLINLVSSATKYNTNDGLVEISCFSPLTVWAKRRLLLQGLAWVWF